jgi:hypothetical protein
MRTLTPLLSLALLAACSNPGRSLQPFSDCDEMQSYMQRMANKELRDSFGGRGINIGATQMDMAFEESADSAPTDYSTTNLQEVGVDESDLVKTDGVHLYALAGGQLIVTRAWPIAQAAQLGSVELDGWPRGMYLLEDGVTVVVLSDLYWGDEPQPLSEEDVSWRYAPSSLVSIVDVTDPTDPHVVRETYVTGQLMTTRRIENKLFAVTYEDIDLTVDADSRRAARTAIYRSEPWQWQGRRFDNRLVTRGDPEEGDVWDSDVGPTCGCEDTYYADDLGGTFVANALVLDLSDPMSEFEGTAVAGRSDTVYASPEALYIAYSEVRNGVFTSFDDVLETVVHKFDITGDLPSYAATGIVTGVLTDQFAISEKDSILRIATTNMGRSRDESDVDNGVYTYEQVDDTLQLLDYIDGLAPTESITAARFIGDFGYITTWEILLGDPLFTFDLSDPADIKLGGELAVTGWSDYLHAIGDGYLVSVGMETDTGGWGNQLAISLFDVTDMENPTLKERELLDAWGSEAQNEHHAFNYFPPTESLTIPSWATQGETVLEVIHVTTEEIEPIGRIAQSQTLTTDDYWCTGVRRSVVMDDWVWAISNAGMTAAQIADPSGQQFAIQFQGVDPCDGGYYGEGWW